jgi:hypothetical protein
VMLTRTTRFSGLKRWALEVAKRRGLKRARVALARKRGVALHQYLDRRNDLPLDKTKPCYCGLTWRNRGIREAISLLSRGLVVGTMDPLSRKFCSGRYRPINHAQLDRHTGSSDGMM